MNVSPEDQHLLNLLRANARTPVASLARALGTARTTVAERIRRLEREGIIEGYTVRLSAQRSEQTIAAHVLLQVNAKKMEAVMRDLRAIPFVRSVYALSGNFDYLAQIEGESTQKIDAILDQIGRIEGIDATQTSIVLSVKFTR